MSALDKRVVALDGRVIFGTSTGDSTYWTSLVRALQALDDPIQFLIISDKPAPPEFEASDRFKWIYLPAKTSRWWSLVQFPLLARKLGAKAIHVQYSLSPLIGTRGITTIHDVSFRIGPEWFLTKDRLILNTSVPMAIRRAARVITVSHTSQQEIEQLMPDSVGKIVATPLGCPDWIRRVEREEAVQMVRDRLGVEGKYVMTVGTRWPRKNMSLAIQAMNGLSDDFPQRMVVTGKSGWGEQDLGLRGLAVGYVDANLLSALYSAADLYLAPSRHEGFGIPLLEAFRCGCPVMCSSGGALPEVAGMAAVVEDSWQASNWTQTIGGLLGDPSKLDDLRNRGFEREKQFSWQDTARRTLDVYREVAI